MTSPRISLLHATPVAIEPIQAAFVEHWPEALTTNLLDDALSPDVQRNGLNNLMIDRFVALGRYAHQTGAEGVLITCSAFGPAIDRLKQALPVPVLKPNEAMFREAIAQGRNIGMLATFGPSIATMEDEFAQFVAETGTDAHLKTILVDDAIDRLREGDEDTHNRLVAERAPELANCDAIMLAHFSTSRAEPMVRKTVEVPVLTAPTSAVLRMKSLLAEKGD